MPEQEYATFRTVRTTDRDVIFGFKRVRFDVAGTEESATASARVESLFPIKDVPNDREVSVETPPIKTLLDQSGIYFRLVRMAVGSAIILQYVRNLTSPDTITDTVSVLADNQQIDPLAIGKAIQSVRQHFKTIDKQSVLSSLNEHEQASLIHRGAELQQLGEISRNFFKELTESNHRAEQSLHKKIREVEAAAATERQIIKDEENASLAKITSEREAFERDKKDYDDRNARTVRRAQRDQLLKTLAIRGKILTRQEADIEASTLSVSLPNSVSIETGATRASRELAC